MEVLVSPLVRRTNVSEHVPSTAAGLASPISGPQNSWTFIIIYYWIHGGYLDHSHSLWFLGHPDYCLPFSSFIHYDLNLWSFVYRMIGQIINHPSGVMIDDCEVEIWTNKNYGILGIRAKPGRKFSLQRRQPSLIWYQSITLGFEVFLFVMCHCVCFLKTASDWRISVIVYNCLWLLKSKIEYVVWQNECPSVSPSLVILSGQQTLGVCIF